MSIMGFNLTHRNYSSNVPYPHQKVTVWESNQMEVKGWPPKCKLGAEETGILVSNIRGCTRHTTGAKGNMKVLEAHQVKQGINQNTVLLTLRHERLICRQGLTLKSSPEDKNILLQA